MKRPKGVSVKTALVYAGQLAPIGEADGYFDAIIPIERILGLPEGRRFHRKTDLFTAASSDRLWSPRKTLRRVCPKRVEEDGIIRF